MVAYAYKLNPQSPMVAVLYALYFQRQADGAAALTLLQSAVALEPNNPVWWAAFASAQAQSGDVTGALDTYQKAIDLAPQDPTYWRLLAAFTANYDHMVKEVGVHAALQAYAINENDPANCEIMGLVMLKQEQYAAAEFYLQRALALDEQRAAANFYLGLLALQQNDPNRARAYLEKARQLDANGVVGAQAGRILEKYFP
jgi:tetratricopeptide (TPR) repeat protein